VRADVIPVLTTERLRLRAHRLEDFTAFAAMWADPRVTEFISGRPSTEELSWARLLRYAGHWALLGFGYWAIEERASGLFAGELGFADYRRAIEPPLDGVPELGWILAPAFFGKGYATEAARAVNAWGDAHFGGRTVCLIDPRNVASIRVAEKCGFHESARPLYLGEPTILFERVNSRRAPPSQP
jgi:RimJ/RimL family protein N-acetyltransferase